MPLSICWCYSDCHHILVPKHCHSYIFNILLFALYIYLIFGAAVTAVIFGCPDTTHTYPPNVLPLVFHYLLSLPLLSATFLWMSLYHFSGGTHCIIIFNNP